MEPMNDAPQRIAAVLFDFDGTITTPGHLDFPAIRNAVGCPPGTSILTYIEALDLEKRATAERILDEFEMKAAAEVLPAPGIAQVIAYLDSHGLQRGILTRNTLRAVKRSLENMPFLRLDDFSCVITREDEIPVKPEPDGVLVAAKRFGVTPAEMLVVGDYLYDVEAGHRAGSYTVFVDNLSSRADPAPQSDFTISDLRSLICLLHPYLNPHSG